MTRRRKRPGGHWVEPRFGEDQLEHPPAGGLAEDEAAGSDLLEDPALEGPGMHIAPADGLARADDTHVDDDAPPDEASGIRRVRPHEFRDDPTRPD